MSQDTVTTRNQGSQKKNKIFQEMHDKPIGDYLEMNRAYDRLKLFTTWPGMKQELGEHTRRCETCQKNKITKQN